MSKCKHLNINEWWDSHF